MKFKLSPNFFTHMGTSRPHSFISNVISKAMLLLVFALGGNAVFAQITFQGSGTIGTSTSATLTISRPTNVLAGDLMIVNIAHLGNNTNNPNLSGWTLVNSGNFQGGGSPRKGAVLYKVAGASEPASYTFTLSSGVTNAVGRIIAFSGVDPNTPIEVNSQATNSGATTTVQPASINTTANAAVIFLGQAASNPTWNSWSTATSPGTLTELYDSPGAGFSIGAAWALKAPAGGTGLGTATLSASQRNNGIMLALKRCIVTAGAASSSAPVCLGATITNITHSTTNATGIDSPTGLPSGITATWASNTITISGVPSEIGTFNYSIPVNGICGSATATGTITVNANNTITLTSAIGTDAQNLCASAAITNITYATTGATSASVTGLPTGVTGNWASNVFTISGTPTQSGTFNYTVTMTGGCTGGTNTASGSIDVTPAPAAPSATSASRCGTGSVTLNASAPSGITLDWFAANTGGSPLTGGAATSSYTTPSISSTTSYYVQATNASTGCSSARVEVVASINPFPTSVSASVSPSSVCSGGTISLSASATSNSAASITLLSESFNTANANWTIINNSSGGTPANAAWTIQPNNYIYNNGAGTVTFTTPDASSFMFSNSDAQGSGGTTEVALISPAFSTVGVSAANINLNHYFRFNAAPDKADIDLSVDGNTWITLTSYTSTQGAPTAFANSTIALGAAYLNQPTVYVRLRYVAAWGWFWAINSITVTSSSTAAVYSWTSAPAGFTSNIQNPTGVVANATGTYTVTATNNFGCSASATTSTLTINTPPTVAAPASPNALCAGNSYTPTAPSVIANGSAVTSQGWQIETAVGSNTFTALSTPYAVTFADNAKKVRYTATNSCGTSSSTTVTLSVNSTPTIAAPAATSALCIGGQYNPLTPSITANGATITSQGWQIETAAGSNSFTTLTIPYTVALADNGKDVRYTATNNCGTSTSAIVTLNVNSFNTITLTSAAGTNNQQTCQNGAITAITYATTGATGASVSGLPTGVSGNWVSNVFTISGTPTVGGTFNYTITMSGGCPGSNNSASGSITVNAASTIYSHNFSGLANTNTAYNQSPLYTTPAGTLSAGLSGSVWTATSAGAAVSFTRVTNLNGSGNPVIAFSPGQNVASTLCLQLTINPGYELSINSFNLWRMRQTATSPNISSITVNGTTIFGGETSPTTGASLGTKCVSNPVNNLTGVVNVIINLSPSSETGGNRYFYLDDFTLNGTVTSNNPYSEVYLHNFNDAPNGSPYTTSPTATTGIPSGIFNSNFVANSSTWTSSTGTLTNTPDANGGDEIALLTPLNATSTLTLTFSVACGYELDVMAFDFFQQRQTNICSNISSITINGIQVYAGSTASTSGSYIGITSVANPINNITGTVTVVINLTASSETTGNRYFYFDDFTLYGTVVPHTVVPAQPAAITGAANPCAATTGHTYSIAPVAYASTYNWSVPAGWTITAGAGTTSITVTAGSAGQNGNISVTAQNCIGTSPAQTLAVTVNTVPAQPGAVTGITSQCPASTSQTYSIAAVPNTTTYIWTVPTGWTITAGAGTTSITVTTGTAGQNGLISVIAQNICGNSATRTLAVTVITTPAQPGTIAGLATQCPGVSGVTYSIASVTNATSYNWSVPTGWTITAGAGTTSITVTTGSTGQNGNISVTAQNACGTGVARNLAVTVAAGTPAQPGAITGSITQCPVVSGQTYSISAVANATSYVWTVPTGWSITAGAGTTSVTVSSGAFGQNGAVRVSAQNSCGTSTTSNLSVTINARPTAVISGSATVCAGISDEVSLDFTGTGPWSGTLSNGQSFSSNVNHKEVDVTPSATTTYTISTLSDANCPAVGGLTGSAVITVNQLPTATISGSATVCAGNSTAVTINGPANGQVAYTVNGIQEGVMLNGLGSAVINTGSVWQNMNYQLVEVEDGICENLLSATATITYQEAPDATISAASQLCQGSSTTVTFNGNANAIVTYNVNGGSNQTLLLNGSGIGSFNTGALNATTTYNLVSVASGSCASTIGTSAVVTIGSSIYYQDNDGDGFGNSAVTTVACTLPAGYATVGGDCCDSNPNVSPICEWWGDMDGDGYGSFIYDIGCIAGVGCSNATWPAGLIPYCPLANFGVLYSQDCNDFSTAINPAAAEICNNTTDDDCDGIIGDGCSGQMFDQWATAQLLNVNNTNAYYPNCQTYSGTMVNTDISAEGNPANVAVGGGRDVWYKFVAPTTGVRIRVTATAFNPIIELRTSPYAAGPAGNNGQVDVENANPAIGGTEVLNFGNLVAGQIYYVGVRNYDATNVGSYTICVSPLRASTCSYTVPAGGFSLCNTYKADFTSASAYTFNFSGISGAANGINTSATLNTNLISLSNAALGIRFGSGYNVAIDAHYALTNGLGQPDGTITVLGSSTANCQNVLIMQQPQVAVASSQICPAVLLRSGYLNATPVNSLDKLCGVINYTFEFTRVTDCTGTTTLGSPFTVNTIGSSASILLSSAFPVQQANTGYWRVRVRPNFANNVAGVYGPAKVITVSGTAASQMLDEAANTHQTKTMETQALSAVYPNPNNGSEVNINLTDIGSGEVAVKIMDALGRTIYSNRYTADGSLFTKIDFAEQLTGGIYLVEFTINGETMNERMIVER